MSKKIVEMHARTDKLFVVVGAAHMVGPLGLVSLLRENGYHIEQLLSESPISPVADTQTTESLPQ